MKILSCFLTMGALCAALLSTSAAETNVPITIGVYDSRAVAFAHFWSAPYQKKLQDKMSAARAAKEAGESAKFKELSAALEAEQAEDHRQVFSTAPAADAMEVLRDRLSEIQKQAGVTVIVSKWDEATLKKYPAAARVDVTEKLVREFIQPNEQQLKIISSIQNSEPIPLEKCNEMIRKGEL